MNNYVPCCLEFAEQAKLKGLAGGGVMYPLEHRPRGQIEYDPESKKWDVNGCCGGGCYVIKDLVFCPWCGSVIPEPLDGSQS